MLARRAGLTSSARFGTCRRTWNAVTLAVTHFCGTAPLALGAGSDGSCGCAPGHQPIASGNLKMSQSVPKAPENQRSGAFFMAQSVSRNL